MDRRCFCAWTLAALLRHRASARIPTTATGIFTSTSSSGTPPVGSTSS
jgi:hypothetical protein